MRTRSQGPAINEDRTNHDPPLSPLAVRNGEVAKPRRGDGKNLVVDVEEASTRTSYEAPNFGRDNTIEARRPVALPEKLIPVETEEEEEDEDEDEDGQDHSPLEPQVGRKRMDTGNTIMRSASRQRRKRSRSPWSCSFLTLVVSALAAIAAFAIVRSFMTRQLDPNGCDMSYTSNAWAKFHDFDTEHTRFASKYSLYLHRVDGIDSDSVVRLRPRVRYIEANIIYRSKEFPYSSSLAMLGVTSRPDHTPPRLRSTFTRTCKMIPTPWLAVSVASTGSL